MNLEHLSKPFYAAGKLRTTESNTQPLTFWEVLGSVLAGALGVQSSKNRQRDFTRGNIVHFIIIGIVFTVLFVFTVISLVQWILPT